MELRTPSRRARGAAVDAPKVWGDIPPSDTFPMYRNDRRLAVLSQWRRSTHYRLSKNEMKDLEAYSSTASLLTCMTVGSMAGVWWITGTQHRSLQTISRSVPRRMMATLAMVVPFSVILSNAQDEYFEKTAGYTTPYGHFAKHVRTQGERLARGEKLQPYHPPKQSKSPRHLLSVKAIQEEEARKAERALPSAGETAAFERKYQAPSQVDKAMVSVPRAEKPLDEHSLRTFKESAEDFQPRATPEQQRSSEDFQPRPTPEQQRDAEPAPQHRPSASPGPASKDPTDLFLYHVFGPPRVHRAVNA